MALREREAVRTSAEALRLNPSLPDNYNNLGVALRALGKPVGGVPYAGGWRWLRGRDDNPWYPTMRLFRQNAPGAWEPVFERLAKAFAEEAGGAASGEG